MTDFTSSDGRIRFASNFETGERIWPEDAS